MIVSIIVPVHQTHSFFEICVKSALSQTHQNIELILACNGALEIQECQSFLKINDPRIVYLKTENGRHNARNEAILIAKGEWIQFLDYDDYLFPDKIDLQIKDLQNYANAKFSICQWKKFNENITEGYTFPFIKLYDQPHISASQLVQKLGINGGFIATASWLVTKEFIQEIKWIDSPNDDAVFLSEILKKSPDIIVVPKVLVGYRIHINNTSSLRTKSEFNKLLKSWNVIGENLKILKVSELNKYLFKNYLNLVLYSKELKGYRILNVLFSVFYFGMKSGLGFSILFEIKKKLLK